jgi:hypothetical protein
MPIKRTSIVSYPESPGRRRIYTTWAEGKAPDVVIETTSR